VNIFDGLSKQTFDICCKTMGYECSWTNSQASPSEAEVKKVLFRDPSEPQKKYSFGQTFAAGKGLEFKPQSPFMEYRIDHFVGLMENVRASIDEFVTINELIYYVREVHQAHDGRTYFAVLDKKRNQ
jgi:hypothetical protein